MNAPADRLRREMGVAYRIALLDEALAIARRTGRDEMRSEIESVLRSGGRVYLYEDHLHTEAMVRPKR